MTDSQFLKRMIALTEKLCDVYNVEPLDQEARMAVRDEIHKTWVMFDRSRRRPSWFAIASVCFILLMLAWVIYTIVCEL